MFHYVTVEPWVGFIMVMCYIHLTWVYLLLIAQLFQVGGAVGGARGVKGHVNQLLSEYILNQYVMYTNCTNCSELDNKWLVTLLTSDLSYPLSLR